MSSASLAPVCLSRVNKPFIMINIITFIISFHFILCCRYPKQDLTINPFVTIQLCFGASQRHQCNSSHMQSGSSPVSPSLTLCCVPQQSPVCGVCSCVFLCVPVCSRKNLQKTRCVIVSRKTDSFNSPFSH